MRPRGVIERARRHNPLPPGAVTVGAGLAVAGLAAYGFLAVSARALGPERHAPLSALWALVFLAGPGFFLPVEQEVARAVSARLAAGVGGAPVVRLAAAGGAVVLGVLAVALAAASPGLLGVLLDDEALLLAGLGLALAGYWLAHLVRGALSGTGAFGGYGLLIGGEGAVRLAVCAALAIAGVRTAGPYGLALGVAPFAGVALALGARRGSSGGLLRPGPPAPWHEVSAALGWLLAGSVLAQLMINAGPLLVKALAEPAEAAESSRFLAGLVVARVPLFLFQAVQASLVPALSSLAAAGRGAELVARFRRLVLAVAALGAGATLACLAAGPEAVGLLFGDEFRLARADLVWLAAASGAYVLALTVAQGLIALAGYRPVVAGWLAGAAVLALVTVVVQPLLLRVEAGLLAGALAAAAVMAAQLGPRLASLRGAAGVAAVS